MRGLIDENGEIQKTPEEDKLQAQIMQLKREYQTQYNELKDLKTEIERIQNMLERCRETMQKDFEDYISLQKTVSLITWKFIDFLF